MTSPRTKFVLVTALLLLATPSHADNDVPVVCFRTSDFSVPNALPERQIESLYKLALKVTPNIERGTIKRARIFEPENAKIRDKVLLTDICEDGGKSCIGLAYRRQGKGFLTAEKFWYGTRGLKHTSLDPDSESDTPFADSKFFFPNEAKGIYTISWSRRLGPRDIDAPSPSLFFNSAKMDLKKSDSLEGVHPRTVPKCFSEHRG